MLLRPRIACTARFARFTWPTSDVIRWCEMAAIIQPTVTAYRSKTGETMPTAWENVGENRFPGLRPVAERTRARARANVPVDPTSRKEDENDPQCQKSIASA